MFRRTTLRVLLVLCFSLGIAPPLFAADYGPTALSNDLRALMEGEPAIRDALAASLQAAQREGIDDIDDFHRYIDRIVRLVPSNKTLLEEVRPLFFVIGHSDYLNESEVFQDWVKRFVNSYGEFLDTTQSAAALQSFYDNPAFKIEDYYEGPSGWLTFNQFFARQVKPGKRPIAGVGDGFTVTAPADGVFRGIFPVAADVSINVKGIKYSIHDLLDGSEYAEMFAGGTFVHSYQAITDYHRFHVPFAGEIVERKNIAGYVWLDLEETPGGEFISVDETGFQWRQERGIIVLSTENIGLVALVAVGMGLVGDVNLTPDVGAELYKGEEFGFFQFGGSDMIMVFQENMVDITAEEGVHYLQGQAIGTRR